jgi:pimeloyl-ACP methyl ester carboxylesterase
MRIRSRGEPDAPALVLIHGLSSSHHSWQRNMAALGATHRLLVVELFPSVAGPRFSITAKVAALRRALAAESSPVAAIGHSLGGLIAMQLAVEAPNLVKRLVLVDVPVARSPRSITSQLLAVAASGSRTDLRSVAIVARTVFTANPLQLASATRLSLRTDSVALAGRLAIPSLLVWGGADTIVPPEMGAQLAAAIPDARLIVIPDAGHQPQWDRPEEFHAAVLPFLRVPTL